MEVIDFNRYCGIAADYIKDTQNKAEAILAALPEETRRDIDLIKDLRSLIKKGGFLTPIAFARGLEEGQVPHHATRHMVGGHNIGNDGNTLAGFMCSYIDFHTQRVRRVPSE